MNINSTTQNEINKLISESQINVFFLLETEVVEDALYEKPKPDADEIPDVKRIDDIIDDVDFHSISEWVWLDSKWDDNKEQGPYLVQLASNSALIEFYMTVLAPIDGGIIFTSKSDLDDLQKHFKSIMTVRLPDNDIAYFRLQEPLKLVGVLGALSESRASDLLGPVNQVFWLENCGAKSCWYHATNSSDDKNNEDQGLEWFKWEREEMKYIDDYDLKHFKNSIFNTLSQQIDSGEYMGIDLGHLKKYNEEELRKIIDKGILSAKSQDFTNEERMKEFIFMWLHAPEVMNSSAAHQIVQNNDEIADVKIYHLNNLIKNWKENNV